MSPAQEQLARIEIGTMVYSATELRRAAKELNKLGSKSVCTGTDVLDSVRRSVSERERELADLLMRSRNTGVAYDLLFKNGSNGGGPEIENLEFLRKHLEAIAGISDVVRLQLPPGFLSPKNG